MWSPVQIRSSRNKYFRNVYVIARNSMKKRTPATIVRQICFCTCFQENLANFRASGLWRIFLLISSVFCQNRQQKDSANKEIWNIGRSWAAQCKAVWPCTPPLSKSVTKIIFFIFKSSIGAFLYVFMWSKNTCFEFQKFLNCFYKTISRCSSQFLVIWSMLTAVHILFSTRLSKISKFLEKWKFRIWIANSLTYDEWARRANIW